MVGEVVQPAVHRGAALGRVFIQLPEESITLGETVDRRLHVVRDRLPQPVLQLAFLMQLGQSSSVGLFLGLGGPGIALVVDRLCHLFGVLSLHSIKGLRTIEKIV